MRYDPAAIEAKWQERWLKEKIYEPDFQRSRRPFYNLMMFPYPSAEGLHVGNMYAFTGADIYGRFKRMQGYDVFEPIGLDGFGIHSENYALSIGKHPADQAKISEKNFYRQLGMIGNGFAWEERLETYDPEYYRWTQWIFVQMFKRGLAYRKKASVNWCPSCLTVLADEQVLPARRSLGEGGAGECERCSTRVVKKDLEQWFFKITAYAERLLKNLEKIDWSERIKVAQRNWIGKSDGALIRFKIKNSHSSVEVFTTRPDTLFGATYIVLAPEHPLIEELSGRVKNIAAVRRYVKQARTKKDDERIAETKAKTGVELKGIRAVNPANDEEIPVWVADYVLGHVGTGAIMAVPAHDERDFAFARKYKLPVVSVIVPVTGETHAHEEFRRSIVAIVENPKTKKILSINWGPQLGGNLFVGGGIEGSDDAFTTAKREIGEETGYTHLKLISNTETLYHHYAAHSKGVNRRIEAIGFYFQLVDEAKKRPRLEAAERDKFRVEWITKGDAERLVRDPLHQLVFRLLVRGEAYEGSGILTHSGKFDGLSSEEAKWAITKAVGGRRTATYRLRDWLISRQRYWGPPIPIIYCRKCWESQKSKVKSQKLRYGIDYAIFDGEEFIIRPVPEKDLPVELPYIKDFRPTGSTYTGPLATHEEFYKVSCPGCGSEAYRETDVSDTFLDSAWYYLRYPSVRDSRNPWDPAVTRKWLPVDMYIGGAEHAVLHLLYVRFLAMVFHDWGLVNFDEPFKRFRAHGLLIKDGAKMSKSRGNVVNPDHYIRAYGADALRMYLMFLGPFEQGGDFRDTGIRGITRFLERVWRFVNEVRSQKAEGRRADTSEVARVVHRTIRKVTDDIEGLQYNTAVSSLMVLLNAFEAKPEVASREHVSILLRLLAPFAPHIAEELWHRTGNTASIHRSPWPRAEPRYLKIERQTLIVQVNGKVRDRVEVEAGAADATVREIVLARERVRHWVGSKPVRKFIYVPDRIVNVVI